ncbi:MAG: hypothetical protein ACRDHB_10430 [Actinomycetota bacterium]
MIDRHLNANPQRCPGPRPSGRRAALRLLVAVGTSLLLASPAVAHESGLADRRPQRAKRQCAPFSHTQTYLTWGPALAYDEPVTVVYSAKRCTKPTGTMVEVTTQGSATVYQGILAQGEPIDMRPFRLTGRWDHPSNKAGWPLSWWGCGVKYARYLWEIPGVYSFDVGARWGLWSLTVSTQPVKPLAEARTVHWSYNAC